MPAWLAKVKRALGAEPDAARRVGLLLKEAHRARVTVDLEPVNQSGPHKLVLAATIEQVLDDGVVISQPLIGALNHPLTTGEHLVMSFGVDSVGRVSGKTQAMGRVQVPSGGARLLYGYRLATPTVLCADERRANRRVTFGSGPPPAAALYLGAKDSPLRGTVQDISAGGILIRVLQEPNLELRLQQRVHLSVQLPPPVGVIDERVTIVRVAPGTNRTHTYIGIAFEGELAGLEDLVRELKDRPHPHRAAG